jgi:hypothetical protein
MSTAQRSRSFVLVRRSLNIAGLKHRMEGKHGGPAGTVWRVTYAGTTPSDGNCPYT